MNIGRIKLDNAFLIFIILIVTGLLQMIGISLDNVRNIITYCIILFFILYKIENPISLGSRSSNYYLIIYFIVISYAIVKSILIYSFSISDMFYALRQYIWIILAIPLGGMLVREKKHFYVFKCILYPYVLLLIVRFITSFLYNVFHITIFNNLLQEYGSLWLRNSAFARLDSTGLMFIALVIAYYLFYVTHNYKYLVILLFIFLFNIIISQTRSVIVPSIFCVLTMLYFSKRRSVNFSSILIVTLLLVMFLIFYYQYFNIMNANLLQYRYYEYQYFVSIVQDHVFGGVGILSAANPNSNSILTGNWITPMYLDDLGILGSIVQFGVIGTVLLYGSLIVLLLNSLFKSIKAGNIGFSIIMSGLFSYIVSSSLLLDLFSIQRIIAVSFVIALISWVNITLGVEK